MTSSPATVDATRHSAVMVCEVCGARDVATTRGIVLRAAARHYELAHPEQPRSAQLLARRAAQLLATRPTRPA